MSCRGAFQVGHPLSQARHQGISRRSSLKQLPRTLQMHRQAVLARCF